MEWGYYSTNLLEMDVFRLVLKTFLSNLLKNDCMHSQRLITNRFWLFLEIAESTHCKFSCACTSYLTISYRLRLSVCLISWKIMTSGNIIIKFYLAHNHQTSLRQNEHNIDWLWQRASWQVNSEKKIPTTGGLK